jgi:hypothetical protein
MNQGHLKDNLRWHKKLAFIVISLSLFTKKSDKNCMCINFYDYGRTLERQLLSAYPIIYLVWKPVTSNLYFFL